MFDIFCALCTSHYHHVCFNYHLMVSSPMIINTALPTCVNIPRGPRVHVGNKELDTVTLLMMVINDSTT